MIDPEHERFISFAHAARQCLPRRSDGRRHVSHKTAARWAFHGFLGCRLEYIRIGRRAMTSVEACQRFVRSLPGCPAAPRARAAMAADLDRRAKALGLLVCPLQGRGREVERDEGLH